MSAARSWLALGVFLAACLAAGGVGGLFMRASSRAWYEQLAKPAWCPPGGVFGPVWTVLYVSMAVAAWTMWRQAPPGAARAPLAVFAVQLVLNAAWTGVFFWARQPGAAFVEIVALWCAIGATVVLFWRVSAAAGALLLPYWAWVSFAAALNFALWRMNV